MRSPRLLVFLAVLVAVAVNLAFPDVWGVRPVTAAVLLLAPGWGLSRWWPPSRESAVTYGFAVLTAALSADVLLACVLGLTGLGLGRTTVALAFGALGLLTTASAPGDVPAVPGLRFRMSATRAVQALLVLAACAAVVVTLVDATASRSESESRLDVTALSITPRDDSAEVLVDAQRDGTYRLVVSLDDQVVLERTEDLGAGRPLSVSLPAPADGATLTAELYRGPSAEVLRTVTLVGSR